MNKNPKKTEEEKCKHCGSNDLRTKEGTSVSDFHPKICLDCGNFDEPDTNSKDSIQPKSECILTPEVDKEKIDPIIDSISVSKGFGEYYFTRNMGGNKLNLEKNGKILVRIPINYLKQWIKKM